MSPNPKPLGLGKGGVFFFFLVLLPPPPIYLDYAARINAGNWRYLHSRSKQGLMPSILKSAAYCPHQLGRLMKRLQPTHSANVPAPEVQHLEECPFDGKATHSLLTTLGSPVAPSSGG